MTKSKTYQKRILCFIAGCGLLAMLGFACLPSEKKVIVCFGDSITHGAQVQGHSWVWHLQQNQKGTAYTYINAGRSGRKTADKEELMPVLAGHPDAEMFVFFLGVNDLKNGNDAMVDSCIENMEWMIDQVRNKAPQAKILLLSPCDINTEIMNKINKEKLYNENTRRSLRKLAKGYRELARLEKTGFMSLIEVVPRLAYADGLHPNKEGQQALYQAISKKILSYDHEN